MSKSLKKYYIAIDKGVAVVNEHQIFKPRWIKHFGGIENVRKFIKSKK